MYHLASDSGAKRHMLSSDLSHVSWATVAMLTSLMPLLIPPVSELHPSNLF